jgi:hypothetical protein
VLVGQSLRGRPALKTTFKAGRLTVGITAALLDERRVFQPFYKGARRAAAASGCHSSPASRAHAGTAGIENRRGQGATFWLRIPR